MTGVSSRATLLLRCVLLVVCLLYLLQLWSPLRLNGDAIQLLSVASSAADGHGFRDHGQKTRYPPGYPAMIAILDRMREARPWTLVGLNAVFLFLGLGCTNYVARNYFLLNDRWAIVTVLFTALSFALIKHFTLPLTDIPFFGTSLAALALTVRAERNSGTRYYALWGAAVSTAIASVVIRPIAIALFPCLMWSLGEHLGVGRILRRDKKIRIACASGSVVLVVLATVVLLRTMYVRDALMVFAHQGTGRAIRDTLEFRVQEIGELFLNGPASKLRLLAPLIWVAGAIGIAILIIFGRRCRIGSVEIYLGTYLSIVLIWPYLDARFWVPVLPCIFAELFSLARPWMFTGWKKHIGITYSACYALMGLAALAYSTSITFAGRNFPLRFGDGNLRATYQTFYSHTHVDGAKVDPEALEVLERYAGHGKQ